MMMARSTKIRPGLLVALKSNVSGGVTYARSDLERKNGPDGEMVTWETTRVITDPVEHDLAIKARGKALSEIRSVCSLTSFGPLCPIDREDDLDAAIVRARAIVAEFNANASYSKVDVYVLKGTIASTDEEAVRAIAAEVTSLISEMNAGIDRLDVKAIREAAEKARQVQAMLGDEEQVVIQAAIAQARKAARDITRRVEKKGEVLTAVLRDISRGDIEKARMAFLDLSPECEEAEASPTVQVQRFADLDVGAPDAPETSAPLARPAIDLD